MGTVGAGKTTQIKLLKKYLEQREEKTVKTYLRSTHGTTFLISKFFQLLNAISDNKISTTEFHKRTQSIWNISESISISTKFLISVYIPYKLGYNVIIEEGLKMTSEHFTRFRPHFLGVNPILPPFIDVLDKWMDNSNQVVFIIDAQDHVLIERRKTRNFRRFESDEFVELQRQSFDNIQGEYVYTIDTTAKTIQDVHREIINHLEKINDP